jgi:hypothetical protein
MAPPRPSSYPTPSSPKNQGFSAGRSNALKLADLDHFPTPIECRNYVRPAGYDAFWSRKTKGLVPMQRDRLVPQGNVMFSMALHSCRWHLHTFPSRSDFVPLRSDHFAGEWQTREISASRTPRSWRRKIQLRPDGAGPPPFVPKNAEPTSAIYLQFPIASRPFMNAYGFRELFLRQASQNSCSP